MERRPACFSLIAAFAVAGIVFGAHNARAQNPGGDPDARKIRNPVAPTAASVAAGASTFKKYCATVTAPRRRVTARLRRRGRRLRTSPMRNGIAGRPTVRSLRSS